jgi:hypothetical protein
MKKDLERMRMGLLLKAMDGKVTARRRKYGYIKTHPKNTYLGLSLKRVEVRERADPAIQPVSNRARDRF